MGSKVSQSGKAAGPRACMSAPIVEVGCECQGPASTLLLSPEFDDDARTDRYELLLSLLIALPLLAGYVLASVHALDHLLRLGIGIPVLLLISIVQGALGAWLFSLSSVLCHRLAERFAQRRD